MNYVLVFDAARNGLGSWPLAAAGLPFIFIGALLVKNRRRLATTSPGLSLKAASAFAYGLLVFAVFWTTVMCIAIYRHSSMLKDALQNGDARVVEGRVEDFTPTPYFTHALEHFTVCGVPFEYSDNIVTEGFNQTSSHGGPLRPGLWVRLAYVDTTLNGNTIARLEIATKDPGAQAECHRRAALNEG